MREEARRGKGGNGERSWVRGIKSKSTDDLVNTGIRCEDDMKVRGVGLNSE